MKKEFEIIKNKDNYELKLSKDLNITFNKDSVIFLVNNERYWYRNWFSKKTL